MRMRFLAMEGRHVVVEWRKVSPCMKQSGIVCAPVHFNYNPVSHYFGKEPNFRRFLTAFFTPFWTFPATLNCVAGLQTCLALFPMRLPISFPRWDFQSVSPDGTSNQFPRDGTSNQFPQMGLPISFSEMALASKQKPQKKFVKTSLLFCRSSVTITFLAWAATLCRYRPVNGGFGLVIPDPIRASTCTTSRVWHQSMAAWQGSPVNSFRRLYTAAHFQTLYAPHPPLCQYSLHISQSQMRICSHSTHGQSQLGTLE
jgi:hypothetical protein